MEIWETIIMKLTKTKLHEIIHEELEKVVKEYGAPVFSPKKEKSQYARRMPSADEDDRTELEKAVSKDKKMKEGDLDEAWEGDPEVKQTGQYADKTKEELCAMKNKLMKKDSRTDAEQKKVRQINFALRSKQKGPKFGKVDC